MDNPKRRKFEIPQHEETFPFVIKQRSAPHIADTIFKYLDQNTLAKCRLVSKVWKDFVDNQTSLWGNVSAEQFIQVAEKGKLDICKLIIQHDGKKDAATPSGWTPLHSSAYNGHLEVCKLLIKNMKQKNPSNLHRQTPLHEAAIGGHVEVCRLIIEKVIDKNPANEMGRTPLHLAAKYGHVDVCRLIIENVEDVCLPRDKFGKTPLDFAILYGGDYRMVEMFKKYTHLKLYNKFKREKKEKERKGNKLPQGLQQVLQRIQKRNKGKVVTSSLRSKERK